MNREQYIKELKKRLRKLPKEDFKCALDYFEEYFAEVGPENEQQAILDLGTPQEAAEQIIKNLALENAEKPVKNVNGGLKSVWVGILAVCAAPVALPLFLVLVLTVVILFLAAVLVIAALLLCGAAIVVTGPFCIIGGFMVITQNPPAAMICMGWGLAGIGIGLLMIYGVYLLGRKFLDWTVKLFGRIVRRGDKKHV